MASERRSKGIPAGYREVDGIIRTDDEHGTPLKLRDCKTADEKIRWHQLQIAKVKADESKRARKDRNHRFIENAAHLEYLLNKPIIGEAEAEKRKKASDYEIKFDRKLVEELAKMYMDGHPEKYATAENANEDSSQVTVAEIVTEGSWQ